MRLGLAGTEGKAAGSVLTTRTSTMEPPPARAMRAAMGSARSARPEPSRGTRIRLNMYILLQSAPSSLSWGIRLDRAHGEQRQLEVEHLAEPTLKHVQ